MRTERDARRHAGDEHENDERPEQVERGRTLAGAPLGRSPLNLRLGLAVFGLVACGALAALCFVAGLVWLGAAMCVLAVVAAVDLAVVARRVVRRRRRGEHHTLFE
ncbi:DUF6343 family protein [Actinomadura atramentaria]|uniref:DUF6343 family protein n=1 Tax=Actinomadura atramentaria TaxID=1990 RepID=UPI0003828D50|nr:DUF6343 family protein [Actinomadura atramentaria]